jgi:UDP-N-acetylglucosamine 2-epimerase
MSGDQKKSNEDLVQELITAFANLKQKLEDPTYIQLNTSIDQLIENQKEMKEDISELKRMFLNPFDGAIVEIQKNTAHRKENEDKEQQYDEILEEHKALVRWKSNFTRVGLAIITSLGAILTWLLTEIIK